MSTTILSETPVFDLSDATICLIALSVAVLVLLFLLVRTKIKTRAAIMNKISEHLENQSQESAIPDHSLVLKVADELIRIEANLSKMDPSVKGFKQISKAVERIRTNFEAYGYEIVDMLGKPYDDGMKVVANFVSDESLTPGAQVITSISKPQINYNGVMIQSAQVTVSQNI